MSELDKQLLEKLTTSQGNLIEDQELMEVLNDTKSRAKDVKMTLVISE